MKGQRTIYENLKDNLRENAHNEGQFKEFPQIVLPFTCPVHLISDFCCMFLHWKSRNAWQYPSHDRGYSGTLAGACKRPDILKAWL